MSSGLMPAGPFFVLGETVWKGEGPADNQRYLYSCSERSKVKCLKITLQAENGMIKALCSKTGEIRTDGL